MSKPSILIIDDIPLNREIIIDSICSEDYTIYEADNGFTALQILQEHPIDLILLDLIMPQYDGWWFLEMATKLNLDKVVTVIISASFDKATIERCFEYGVMDFITRPFSPVVLANLIKNWIAFKVKKERLLDFMTDTLFQEVGNGKILLQLLARISEFKCPGTGSHIVRVQRIMQFMLTKLLENNIIKDWTAAKIETFALAAGLHDIGKMALDDDLLNTSGPLKETDLILMRAHTLTGAVMLQGIRHSQQMLLVQAAISICKYHHERWDGSGYPYKLQGDATPIEAQLVAIIDCYDALTHTRLDRPAYSSEKAISMLLTDQCGKLNPILLDIFINNITVINKISNEVNMQLDKAEIDQFVRTSFA